MDPRRSDLTLSCTVAIRDGDCCDGDDEEVGSCKGVPEEKDIVYVSKDRQLFKLV
jgi:hypothetical protein